MWHKIINTISNYWREIKLLNLRHKHIYNEDDNLFL
jgi:hypothetical protein